MAHKESEAGALGGSNGGALQALSNDLVAAVERSGGSVVAVHGRERTPSSGVIWREGLVITTDHTLRKDDGITVTLTDGKTLEATVAGRDPSTDLALLRVPGLAAPGAQVADAASVRVGAIVLAIGRGLSASLGVISSVGGPWRTWRGGLIDQYVRPDVSVYLGFSGGLLADSQGRIIGVNTSGLSRGGALTVPASTVNRVADELGTRGRIARGYLGIGMQPVQLPGAAVQSLGLSSSIGLILLSVEAGGPAEQGGLLVGDVLFAVDGKAVHSTGDLQAALAGDRIGKAAEVKVVRGGVVSTLTVTIGERK